jgi:hypothetical protein
MFITIYLYSQNNCLKGANIGKHCVQMFVKIYKPFTQYLNQFGVLQMPSWGLVVEGVHTSK